MDNLTIIAKYEQILKERGISKKEFYAACGFSDAAVSQWRKGKTNPSVKNIKAIESFLSLPDGYLLSNDEPKSALRIEFDKMAETLTDDEMLMALDMIKTIKAHRK